MDGRLSYKLLVVLHQKIFKIAYIPWHKRRNISKGLSAQSRDTDLIFFSTLLLGRMQNFAEVKLHVAINCKVVKLY